MKKLEQTLSDVSLLQDETLDDSLSELNPQKKKIDKTMRTANIRVSAVNKINEDNEKLGVKAGDIVVYTKESLIRILEEWNTKRTFSYFIIEHNEKLDNIHFHIVIIFDDHSVCKFSLLKKKFPYGDIECCRFGVKNCIQYLTHMNHLEKYQYSWDDVTTNNPAKLELYKIPTKRTTDAKLNYILDQIYKGNIREYEIGSKIDYEIYLKHENRIMRAFRYLNEKNVVGVDRELQVYVLQGPPRVGKSTFCKCWAKNHNMSIGFSSGGKHKFDEIRDQDIIVLDDYNYSDTDINSMKKLLDPYNNTGTPARYHNRLFNHCKVIFICTNTPIVKWYLTESMEDREAIFKRISYVLDFEELSDDYVATYTVNEIVYCGEIDSIKDGLRSFHDYKKYKLVSVDNEKHIFDLKKYINPSSNEAKKQEFLTSLGAI